MYGGLILIKLSVYMPTYNHEKYIRESIDSVLMQEVSFDYEIVIGEDCSPDNTRYILKEYEKEYPNKIKLILHEKNVGPRLNGIEIAKNCNGEYIAILEGDDFWTDKRKLQNSVDFLERNPHFIATAHDVYIIDEKHRFLENGPYGNYKGDLLTPLDQFKYNNIPTLSLVFRNIWGKDYPLVKSKIQKNVKIVGDYPFKLFLLTNGKIKYFSEKMGTYRWVRSGGTSFSSQSIKEINLFEVDMIHALNNLCEMNTGYDALFKRQICRIKATAIWNYIWGKKIKLLKDFIINFILKGSFMEFIGVCIWLSVIPIRRIIRKILKVRL